MCVCLVSWHFNPYHHIFTICFLQMCIYIYIHPNQGPTEKSQVDLPILEAGLAIFPASSCRPFDEAVPPLRGFRNVEKWGKMWQKW